MFITLLLITPALCEWVEISQHRVRKPPRPHTYRPTEKIAEDYFEETTRSTKIYLNQSLTERPWNRGNVNKVPKIGNIQRVQLDNSPIKAPSLSVEPGLNYLNRESIKTGNKNYIKDVSAKSDLTETNRDRYESGSDAGSERREPINDLKNSIIEKVNSQLIANPNKIFQTSTGIDEITKPSLNNKNKRPLNELQRVSFHEIGSRNSNTGVHNGNITAPKKKTDVTLRPQIFGYGFNKDVESTNIILPPPNANKKPIKPQNNGTTQNLDTRDDIPKRQDMTHRPGSITRSKITNHGFVTKVTDPMSHDLDATVSDEEEDHDTASSSEPTKQNSAKEVFGQHEVEPSNNNQGYSLENLMTFMKVIADTIKKNTRRSVYSKTRYLTNLKNTILDNIADRIDAAWPDDAPATLTRTARAAHASSRGHVEIPSSESALMTISFLTFAVFLIKLVLQVIQTYKNKAMMVSPAVVAVGRAALKRSLEP